MTNDLTSIIASIRRIGADAESVVAALSEHIRNEPDAIRAGPLRRLHQVLQDYVHQSKLALGQSPRQANNQPLCALPKWTITCRSSCRRLGRTIKIAMHSRRCCRQCASLKLRLRNSEIWLTSFRVQWRTSANSPVVGCLNSRHATRRTTMPSKVVGRIDSIRG
jgi:hypothetical protein